MVQCIRDFSVSFTTFFFRSALKGLNTSFVFPDISIKSGSRRAGQNIKVLMTIKAGKPVWAGAVAISGSRVIYRPRDIHHRIKISIPDVPAENSERIDDLQ